MCRQVEEENPNFDNDKYLNRMITKRLKLPDKLTYPVQIVTVHFAAGQKVATGDALYTLKDSKGKSGVMRAPFAGTIIEGPVPEGVHFATAQPVLGLVAGNEHPIQSNMNGKAEDAAAEQKTTASRAKAETKSQSSPTRQTKSDPEVEASSDFACFAKKPQQEKDPAARCDASPVASQEKLGLAVGGLILLVSLIVIALVAVTIRLHSSRIALLA
ncbi:hypothetical protein [Roseobacter sp. GAI101]|uniref:hypothetical protein n=1 Tax=Roseobacter sp. (strain GAI101) TaxID=391589 RepID=UPI000187257B|nr:hypothetical protein [Roseobacter sp. GAI101]EEB86353.1 hypothetical protein RGAI101_3510 [Roseobacter sp. GAI101]